MEEGVFGQVRDRFSERPFAAVVDAVVSSVLRLGLRRLVSEDGRSQRFHSAQEKEKRRRRQHAQVGGGGCELAEDVDGTGAAHRHTSTVRDAKTLGRGGGGLLRVRTAAWGGGGGLISIKTSAPKVEGLVG